jgi:succinate dehydrogenase/fumarate reductase flavoprotein subunit
VTGPSDTFDVVVLGTGAAGMTAAILADAEGASVGLFEKADRVGGTAAWSGGMVWIPDNPHMAEAGIADSRDEALCYLRSLSLDMIDEAALRCFVETGPEMVRWLESNTPVRFQIVPGFPDYHPEHPSARPLGGRSLECPLFPFEDLGHWASHVTVGPQLLPHVTMAETPLGRAAPDGVPADEMQRRLERDERGTGQALAGRLLKACLDRGIEPRTGMRAIKLLTEGRRVTGVRFSSADGEQVIEARHAVVLATGGFERDPELVRAFLRGPMTRPAGVPSNTGDGLRMAMALGAGLGNMREAWWAPTIDVLREDGGTTTWLANAERTRPHSIMVNSKGRRFANESVNYNAFGAAFHALDATSFTYANCPAWLIFDQTYWTSYGLCGHRADNPLPSWITQAPTISALAETIGVPATELETTITRWNDNVADGQDRDFGRGTSAVDKWWGDPQFGNSSAATLGALDNPPFYAVEVHSGALGTKGGPLTDLDGRVLDTENRAIPGLYAAGNAMAVRAMGMTYGGAGGTLGPAMVSGFRAGRAAAKASST